MHHIKPSIGVGFKILVGDPLFFPLDGQTKGGVVVGTTGGRDDQRVRGAWEREKGKKGKREGWR